MISGNFLLSIGTNVLYWIIIAVSLNLVVGFAGMLHLGHMAFFAIGGYATAIMVGMMGLPWWLALITGMGIAAILAVIVGWPTLHLRGDYLAIATLGFSEIVRIIVKNWDGLTRGPKGIPGIPRPELFGSQLGNLEFFLFTLVITIGVVLVVVRVVRSPFGRVLRALREDELAAQALGKNTFACKLVILAVAAALVAIAGSLYAHHRQIMDPNTFLFTQMVAMLLFVVLGGLASIRGSIIGVLILGLAPEVLRFLPMSSELVGAVRQLVFALLLIVLMVYRPEGLFKERSATKC